MRRYLSILIDIQSVKDVTQFVLPGQTDNLVGFAICPRKDASLLILFVDFSLFGLLSFLKGMLIMAVQVLAHLMRLIAASLALMVLDPRLIQLLACYWVT